MKKHTVRTIRRLSQGIFLLLFLFLFIQTESKGLDELGYPVRIFLDFDPLIALSTLLSAHAIVAGFLFSLVVVVLTALLGRVFCGWICPLGTLHDAVGFFSRRRPAPDHRDWHRLKYYILFFLLASSLFTAQLAGIMDPISLLIRSLSLSVYPLVNYIARAFFDTVYVMDIPVITDGSEWVYGILKRSVLSFEQPYFLQGIVVGLLFLLILGLNFYERRFWCKHLCPLGALLGICSRYALLKRSVSEGCISCGVCRKVCPSGAVIDKNGTWRGSECLYCMDCDDLCPEGAVGFGWKGSGEGVPIDLSRRNVFVSLMAGVAAVPLLRIVPQSRGDWFHPTLIRPPGALEEEEFLRRCVRCGECMKVCITNGLQPTLLEAGLEGIWTPRLVPKIGYCEFRCTLCGQVCPTGAIQELTVQEKERTKIGVAVIDTGRCLPYAYDIPCIVCEEMCPTPEKAILLEEVKVQSRKGEEIILKRPRVDAERCVGCGICEARCPVRSRPAIYVISANESRSEGNRLLLNP
jgi:MauM/NapG family ferredoxin protein